jgi:hypothetical protein
MKTVQLHPFTVKKIAQWKAGKDSRRQSIHPRVVNGYQQFKKVNTAKPARAK